MSTSTTPTLIPFLLFSGQEYYPQGGWRDYTGSFGSLDEAKAAGEAAIARESGVESQTTFCTTHNCPIITFSSQKTWAQVVDTAAMETFSLSNPSAYCPQCTTEPVYPQWESGV
jgi:hypothetical protein